MTNQRSKLQHASDGIESFDDIGFVRFTEQAKQLGFNNVLVKSWDPNTVLEHHSHPFSVQALVVAGKMWLRVAEDSYALGVGDRFSVNHSVQHAETYGPAGAVVWVARRDELPFAGQS